jgi:hypothetical protein
MDSPDHCEHLQRFISRQFPLSAPDFHSTLPRLSWDYSDIFCFTRAPQLPTHISVYEQKTRLFDTAAPLPRHSHNLSILNQVIRLNFAFRRLLRELLGCHQLIFPERKFHQSPLVL